MSYLKKIFTYFYSFPLIQLAHAFIKQKKTPTGQKQV